MDGQPKSVFHPISIPEGIVDHAGYTLIETLVAMMLLAISLVTIMQLFSGGLRSIKLSNDYERAVFFAQERMEEIRLMPTLVEGTEQGAMADGYRWEAVIRDLDAEAGLISNASGKISRFSIKVTVFWPSGVKEKSYALDAMRIALSGGLDNE